MQINTTSHKGPYLAISLYPGEPPGIRSFDTFEAAAAHMISRGYGEPRMLVRVVDFDLANKEEVLALDCTCHERDSSFTCPKCQAEGYLGHMEGG